MTMATLPKSGFENWQDGINKAVGDAKWDSYDCEIQMAVSEFNLHLSGQGGYIPLDVKHIDLAKSKFEASNKGVLRYREAECAFKASLGGGAIGNALEMQRLACVFELNSRRTDQLRSATTVIPLK